MVKCSGLMNLDTDFGENVFQIEVLVVRRRRERIQSTYEFPFVRRQSVTVGH